MNRMERVTATASADEAPSSRGQRPMTDRDRGSRSRGESMTSGGKQAPRPGSVGGGHHGIDAVLLVPVAIAASLVAISQWLAATPIAYLLAYVVAVATGLAAILWYRTLFARRRHH